ncbi:hypothetical protein O988_06553 [Pseudogymnoascus sp. VKM F-3808]|nr:hypothetical protein O988_06553 [Pseudogymnoascus sp. VKM F-3808]
MGLLHLQSPFSILGLRYSDHTPKAIKSAYKNASLHCHPDKNTSPDIPKTYFTLLGDARAKLLQGGPQLDQFKGYPVIIYPLRESIGKPIFKIPESSAFAVCGCGEILPKLCNTQGCQLSTYKIFKICNACKTPIPEEGFDRHLSQHTDICHICNEVMEKDHYTLRHPEKICPLCPALNEKDHHLSHALVDCLDYLHDYLKCSWCNKAFAEEELRAHIAVSHPPQEFCGDCKYKDTVPGLKIHKMQSHAWQQYLTIRSSVKGVANGRKSVALPVRLGNAISVNIAATAAQDQRLKKGKRESPLLQAGRGTTSTTFYISSSSLSSIKFSVKSQSTYHFSRHKTGVRGLESGEESGAEATMASCPAVARWLSWEIDIFHHEHPTTK